MQMRKKSRMGMWAACCVLGAAVLGGVLAGPARADGEATIKCDRYFDVQRVYLADHGGTVDLHVVCQQGEFILAGIPRKQTDHTYYYFGPEARHAPNPMLHASVQINGKGTYEPWASLDKKYIGDGVTGGYITWVNGEVSGDGDFTGYNGDDKRNSVHVEIKFHGVTQ